VSLAIRIGLAVVILAIGLFALISTAMKDFPMSDPLTAIALWAALWWFGTIRPKVCVSPDELVVRNPLWTRRIARENVVSAKPGSFGFVISRRAGRPYIAVAPLLKPKIADRAASLITHWAETSPSSGFPS
jgi:hypothetical protein